QLTGQIFLTVCAEMIGGIEPIEAFNWDGPQRQELSRAGFKAESKVLSDALDHGQAAALRLDQAWGRLTEDHLIDAAGKSVNVDQWWETLPPEPDEGAVGQIVAHVESARQAMGVAEAVLRPWVLRHRKPAQ